MDAKNKQELDALFAKRAEGQRTAAEAAEIERLKQQAFIEHFYKVRAEVVAPTMREFGEYLNAKGLEFEVLSQDAGSAEQRQGPISASISIAFAPRGKLRKLEHNHAELRFTCSERQARVSMYQSAMWPERGGSSGPAGEVLLEAITAKFVEDKLTALVKQVLSGGFPR
jgi:hypothetical protein